MKIWTVDAFATKPFEGNPAAVCIIDAFLEDALMQSIGAEMAISETCFVVPKSESHFLIRWFTPKDEAPMCAHASLAAAHIVWEQKITSSPVLTFESRIGLLTLSTNNDWIDMDFPAQMTEATSPPDILLRALGATPLSVHIGFNGYLVEFSSEKEIISLNPDLSLIKQLPCRAVTVTARGSAPYDFISRYFAPSVGIDEDPVCGSAHCRLAPYWASRLGKTDFLAYQASERGGIIKASLKDNRVILSGKAVTILEGFLRLPGLV